MSKTPPYRRGFIVWLGLPLSVDKFTRARYNKSMEERYGRTAILLGEQGVEKLKNSRVAVFGVGGVGSYCAEGLARAGVGEITLIDKDEVEESNLNRQLVALTSTIGKSKAEVMRERIADINPACRVNAKQIFYLPETADEINLGAYDFIADCIDNVTAKICLIERTQALGVPVISAMGAGNRLDPTKIRIADLSKTSVCPLARIMRRELKKRGIEHLSVAYSEEEPCVKTAEVIGSVSFVPSVMGLAMAGEIVRRLAL